MTDNNALELFAGNEIEGTVTHILFKSPSDDYAIFRVTEKHGGLSFVAKGIAPGVCPDLAVKLQGEWRLDPQQRKAFVISVFLASEPVPGNEKQAIAFLSRVKHWGPATAKNIWDRFGADCIRILNEDPSQFLSVNRITEEKLKESLESYELLKHLQKLIEVLAGLEVPTRFAEPIYKKYGNNSCAFVRLKPYELCYSIKGFKFDLADRTALKLGFKLDSPERICEGAKWTLKENERKGHCYMNADEFYSETQALLSRPDFFLARAKIDASASIVIYRSGTNRIWRREAWRAEETIADRIRFFSRRRSLGHREFWRNRNNDVAALVGALNAIQAEESKARAEAGLPEADLSLDEHQEKAVLTAATEGFSVLTGGPGTGKSTVARRICQIWQMQGLRVVLAAPTGKAAKRLSEATGMEASTIHRLCKIHSSEDDAPRETLQGDAFLIDEASMVDVFLFARFLDSLPDKAVIAIVGDSDQLPSIGPGAALSDITESLAIPETKLVNNYRQSRVKRADDGQPLPSEIVSTCKQINGGEVLSIRKASIDTDTTVPSEVSFVDTGIGGIENAIKWSANTLESMGYERSEIQFLAPQRNGGTNTINSVIQDLWNPIASPPPADEPGPFGVNRYRVGDRVIQGHNDYDRGIVNGDVGIIIDISKKDPLQIVVAFDGVGVVPCEGSAIGELSLAYALTVHKAQGSEYKAVVIAVSMEFFNMLRRPTYYTALSRAKEVAIFVGEEKALQRAANRKANPRNTELTDKISRSFPLMRGDI